jgi:hypothetical protein
LAQHRIIRVADEGLDLRVLFDTPEDNLDLPAVFVDIADGFGREFEVSG